MNVTGINFFLNGSFSLFEFNLLKNLEGYVVLKCVQNKQ